MGPIPTALNEIRSQIPPAILERAFLDKVRHYATSPANLDALIRSEVLEKRVLPNCNLVGGVQAVLDLSGIVRDEPDSRTSIYCIPPEYLQGRDIVSAHSVSYGFGYSNSYGNYNPMFDAMQAQGCGNAGILTAASALWSAYANMPIIATARTQIIGVNTVMIQDQIRIPGRAWLFCVLAHDSQMTNIQPASYMRFAELCVLATKAYIYNTQIVELNMGAIAGGYDLGIIKDIISEYADANQNYLDALSERWRKTSILNDQAQSLIAIRNLLGTNW